MLTVHLDMCYPVFDLSRVRTDTWVTFDHGELHKVTALKSMSWVRWQQTNMLCYITDKCYSEHKKLQIIQMRSLTCIINMITMHIKLA